MPVGEMLVRLVGVAAGAGLGAPGFAMAGTGHPAHAVAGSLPLSDFPSEFPDKFINLLRGYALLAKVAHRGTRTVFGHLQGYFSR
jgi:hypothetical protein